MINLLPYEHKRQILAARSNVLLVRYNIAIFFVLIAMGGAIFATNYLLTTFKQRAQDTIASNQSTVKDYDQIQNEATQFRTSLSQAKATLAEEIRYSDIIVEIGHLVPAGAVLDSLQLGKDSFSKPMSLSFKVKDESAARALLAAFTASPRFKNVTIGQLVDSSSQENTQNYPYSIDLNLTLQKGGSQ